MDEGIMVTIFIVAWFISLPFGLMTVFSSLKIKKRYGEEIINSPMKMLKIAFTGKIDGCEEEAGEIKLFRIGFFISNMILLPAMVLLVIQLLSRQ